MSEYLHVEQPFLTQLRTLGWEVIDLKGEVRSEKFENGANPAVDGARCDDATVSNFKLHPSNFSAQGCATDV